MKHISHRNLQNDFPDRESFDTEARVEDFEARGYWLMALALKVHQRQEAHQKVQVPLDPPELVYPMALRRGPMDD